MVASRLLLTTFISAPLAFAFQEPSRDEIRLFERANSVKDPCVRMTELRSALRQITKSDLNYTVEISLLRALSQCQSTTAAERKVQAEKLIADARSYVNRIHHLIGVASALVNEHPAEAKPFVERALRDLKWPEFEKAEQQDSETNEKRKHDSAAAKRTFDYYAGLAHEGLGTVYHRMGNLNKAQTSYIRAISVSPTRRSALKGLAEIAESRKRTNDAVRYYGMASLLAEPSSKERFEQLYATWRSSDKEEREQFLDTLHAAMFPNPVLVSAYKPSSRRSGHTVLLELFTGADCGPCAAADAAVDAMLQRYTRQDLAVIEYHRHVPKPDPMANNTGPARGEYYSREGVPGLLIDGEYIDLGGGARSRAPEVAHVYQSTIDRQLETTSDIDLDISVVAKERGFVVRARMSRPSTDSLDLHIVVIEKSIRYSGSNGVRVHPMVARGLFTLNMASRTAVEQDIDLDSLTAKLTQETSDFEEAYTRDSADPSKPFHFRQRVNTLARENLGVVVFVQDRSTKRVLQTKYIDLPTMSDGPHVSTSHNAANR